MLIPVTLWFGILFVLLILRVPVGLSLGLVGALGLLDLLGTHAAASNLGAIAVETTTNYNFAIIPLFIFMGSVLSRTGLSSALYHAAYVWIGRVRGGLAMSTIVSCGGFGAVCGSSMATVATMSRVAVPPMLKYHYSPALAAGSVAAGGTLGIIIHQALR